MRQQHGRNIRVVLQQIPLGNPLFGPESFIEIGQLKFTSANLDFSLVLVVWN
jgi:hypothetical protein